MYAIDLRQTEAGVDFNTPEEKYIASTFGYINTLAFHPTEKVLYAIGQIGSGNHYLVIVLANGISEDFDVGLLWTTSRFLLAQVLCSGEHIWKAPK